jgi:heparinase II/III-like protein
VRGTRVAARLLVRPLRSRVRRLRLRLRPPRANADSLRKALGGVTPLEALWGAAPALPILANWGAELEEAGDEERASLLAVADRIAAHRFDLLGSGRVDLGPEIDWARDFKSGRRWPLDHISRVPIAYDDDSDIKVPWELSRFQHLPVLAAAHRLTGDRQYLEEIGGQLSSWIDANPLEYGPNWACTMDVAIRASNWVAALALCAEAVASEPWLEPVLGSLLLHGRFVRGHLEYAPAHSNHYLADVVGLLPVAALFSGSPEGRAWAEWAAAELSREMEHQVRPDGCDHEMSIPYHRLVCELFIWGTHAIDALVPGALPDDYRQRLERMLAFVADYTRPDGLAPQIGDADDGRFVPLGDYGRVDPRSHLHLIRQAGRRYRPADGHAAYPAGGYWLMRAGGFYAIVRCGDVGMGGLGGHAHNDQLSFELVLGEQPLVVDPGAFIYTADPEARNLFRSTSFHSALRVGGLDQQEPEPGTLFAMRDRAHAECLGWEPDGEQAAWEGCHHGFERLDPPATHHRRFEFDGTAETLLIRDTVACLGSHELEWSFPLAPGGKARGGRREARVGYPGAELVISSAGLEFSVEPGWYSPSYGVREPADFLRARRLSKPGRDVTEVVLQTRR